ncbi:DUF5819 family protein [Streptomyces sp. NPDC047072]|uniref:DUF5819 family protein n=1 Tax=Streptomyces sp. NPDC047072 TaxID=3154809 RepID=UPI0033D93907
MDAYDQGSNARREPDGVPGPTEPAVPAAAGPEGESAPPEPDGIPAGGSGVLRAAAVGRPEDHPEPSEDRPGPPEAHPDPRTGVAALSLGHQIVVAVALAVVAAAVCLHIGMVFLHVAPPNTLTKKHGTVVDDWVFPEFEQNWKLFAPNPLQQNIAVQVRARVATADGGMRETGWYDLSAQDGRAIDGNLLPSHTQQNELRRSWDLFTSTHDADNRPVGLRGALAETYLRRIVVLRLERGDATGRSGVLKSVQIRSRVTNVPAPTWGNEKVSDQPVYRELPWWTVQADDTEESVR